MRTFISAACAVFVLLFAPNSGSAADIPKPEGEVILSVSGEIAVFNRDQSVEFDRQMLEAFEKVTFETSTIWTSGVTKFEGVRLFDFVQYLGVTEGTIRAFAVNDYQVEIPVSDATPDGPIIAYRMNDRDMSIRRKGPLWIMYPFDTHPEYATMNYFSRCIWQLQRFEIEK